MLFHVHEGNMYATFSVDEAGTLSLCHLAPYPYTGEGKSCPNAYPAAAVHIAGRNSAMHHGGKQAGNCGRGTLRYESHRVEEQADGSEWIFTLREAQITADLHYRFYTGVGGLRTWVEVKNVSEENVGLEYVASLALGGFGVVGEDRLEKDLLLHLPYNSWAQEVEWRTRSLSDLGLHATAGYNNTLDRHTISNNGTWSTKEFLPAGVIEDRGLRRAIFFQIEHNGSWHWEFSAAPPATQFYVQLSGPTERENHWYKELAPGESFVSVTAGVAVGTDFDSALGEMTKYRRHIARRNRADCGLPVIFNDYMNCLWADPTTEKELPVIDLAAEMGAEYYCMDAGWYADGTWWETVGEWMPCSWRFPNGIREVFDRVRERGMVPGLWLEIEVMGVNCPILSQFEDSDFFMRHGKRVIDNGRYQLDFRSQRVRDFATSVIDRVVNEYGIGYIKMDYNIDGGIGTEVDSDSFGDGLLGHNRAYRSWMQSIMDKYPDLVIESCSSGGMRMEYGMLSLHPIMSVTDQANVMQMVPIAAACATALLPEQAAIWSYPMAKDSTDTVALNMINALPVRMHLSGEIMKMSDEQIALIKEGVRCYKEWRHEIKTALPTYPLGLPQPGDGWLATAYQNEKTARLAVWRMEGESDTCHIPLPGAKSVRVLYPAASDATATVVEGGLSVTLPRKQTAVYLLVEQA